MDYYIGIEDLAANALIELLEKNETREVSFKALTQYGTAVVKVLDKYDKKAVLVLSRARTIGFVHDCTELFDVENIDSPRAVLVLKEHVSADDLAKEFCGSISATVLRAFNDKESLDVLFSAA